MRRMGFSQKAWSESETGGKTRFQRSLERQSLALGFETGLQARRGH
ncbi:hypothetical protein KGY73_07845 [bacterium]|nr:hypothetical protein [bacterium]